MNDIVRNDYPVSKFDGEDLSSFGLSEVNLVETVCNTVNQVTCTITDAVKYVQNVKLEIKRLDTQLEQFITSTNANLERFKSAMPVLENQLNRISARIDRITETILLNTEKTQEIDNDTLKKHEMLLDLLESANNSFNNMLMRLLAL